MKSILKGTSTSNTEVIFVWSDGSDARFFPVCGEPQRLIDASDYELVPTSEAEALAVLKKIGLGMGNYDPVKLQLPGDEKIELEAAFEKAMTGRLYGPEETADAFFWFKSGWKAKDSK